MPSLDDLRGKGVALARVPPVLDARSWFEPPCVIQAELAPSNLIQVGAFTGIYGGRLGHSKIGRYCSVAPGVDIASDQHPSTWLSSSMIQYVPDIHGWGRWLRANGEDYHEPSGKFESNRPVTIGNDVWIGKNALLRSGVSIGNGAIVAAGAIVIEDVPPYAVVAGVPAKVKRYRFEPGIIESLQRLAWWRFNILSINDIDFSDIKAALDRIEGLVESQTIECYQPDRVEISQ